MAPPDGGGRPPAARGRRPAEDAPPAGALAEEVRRYYTERLERATGCCGPETSSVGALASPGPSAATSPAPTADPPPAGAPADAPAVPSFGCGQPTTFAALRPGETVLDLGSGAGLDVFRAAQAVGPSGRAVGVDMTPAMLARARDGATRLGLANASFLEGTIEALPLDDASVDAVVSNCVINLSQDKPAVFAEAFRVLRPGGRLAVSDVLRVGPRTAPVSVEGWCACVDGAEPASLYRAELARAGFADIVIDPPPDAPPDLPPDAAAAGTYSASIRALKPVVRAASAADLPAVSALLAAAGLPSGGLEAAGTRLWLIDDAGGRNAHDTGTRDADAAPSGRRGMTALPTAVVGLEAHGPAVLLRSLAVREDARGRGYGRALLRHVLAEAEALGAGVTYALTLTIPDALLAWGFEEVPRDRLPAELLASESVRDACPASARAFRRSLG